MRLRIPSGAVPPPRAARRLGLALASAAALAVVLYVGVTAATLAFAEFGFHPERGQQAWRALAPRFADAAVCGACHEPQQAKLVSATHAGLGCQSCHGALAEHVELAEANEPVLAGTVRTPTDEVCVRCHAAVAGQPEPFRALVVADHYTEQCLACHDPHTGISQAPPVVSHTLVRLPACNTCHGPDGFMARLDRHPPVTEDDRTCLACHAPGRGGGAR